MWFKIMGWPSDLIGQVEAIAQPILIPGHEYEMGHKPKYGANNLMPAARGYGRTRAAEGRFVILTWGEKLRIDPRR